MALNFDNLVTKLQGIFGAEKNPADSTAEDPVKNLVSETFVYEWREMSDTAANQHVRRDAQTISLSASQPLLERVIFAAPYPCRLVKATFCQFVSSTVANTASGAWHIPLRKRGGTNGTSSYSVTLSVTTFLAGLSSDSGKHATASQSYSALVYNVARAPNKFCLNKTAGATTLGEGDVITAACLKGSGTATDTGGIFRGGHIFLTVQKKADGT